LRIDGPQVPDSWKRPCMVGVSVLSQMGWWSFFFFQAEDGIRDLIVTGVQTCALPISVRELTSLQNEMNRLFNTFFDPPATAGNRSEERRVGKECSYRGAQNH